MALKKNKQKGFTLIEILVAISLMSLLFTFGVAGYKNMGKRNKFNMDVQLLRSLLVEAQGLSFSPSSESGAVPTGYGVHFDKDNKMIYLFKDTNANNFYNSGEEIKTANFPAGLDITGFEGNVRANTTKVSVIFKVPKETTITPHSRVTYFNDAVDGQNTGDPLTNNGIIKIEYDADQNHKSEIIINCITGLVSIKR